MGAKEVGTLARELAARDPASWPVNLYAADYTDLIIQVLNHEKAVQARQFSGLAPATHGRHQKAFEEVLEILERIHLDVLARGRPVAMAGIERVPATRSRGPTPRAAASSHAHPGGSSGGQKRPIVIGHLV